MTIKTEFWGSVESVPRTTFANLKPETIKKRMIAWLESAPEIEGDLWACRTDINREHWHETMFCFVKHADGRIVEDDMLGQGT